MVLPKLSELIAAIRAKANAAIPARTWVWILAGFLAVAALVLFWKVSTGLFLRPPAAPPMQIAPSATAVAGLAKQPLPQPVRVMAYPKAQAVKRLQLPQEVADDPDQQVISSADLKPSKGGYTTATVLDTRSGEAVTRVTEKPRQLFELGGQTEIGLRFGISTRGNQQMAVYARQDLLRIGIVSIAGYGEANAGSGNPEAKAMIDARISW